MPKAPNRKSTRDSFTAVPSRVFHPSQPDPRRSLKGALTRFCQRRLPDVSVPGLCVEGSIAAWVEGHSSQSSCLHWLKSLDVHSIMLESTCLPVVPGDTDRRWTSLCAPSSGLRSSRRRGLALDVARSTSRDWLPFRLFGWCDDVTDRMSREH